MDTDDPDFLPRLEAYRAAVLMHATREERYEFPHLRLRVPAGELAALVPALRAAEALVPALRAAEALVPALRAAEALAPTRPHPSVQSATGNLLVGPPVAVLDKVRDVVRDALQSSGRKSANNGK
jgi:hypothetical protein